MRTLETVCPLVVESAGVGVTPPGPSHWKSGVPVTPSGRVTEQVRVTGSPATTGEEGEEVSATETMHGWSEKIHSLENCTEVTVCIAIHIHVIVHHFGNTHSL